MAGKDKNLKKWKNWKNPKNTYEFFFALFPIPAGPYVKILLIVVLLSTAVEKTARKSLYDLQNGPYSGEIFLYIYSDLDYISTIYSAQLTTYHPAENLEQNSQYLPSKGEM